MGPLLPNGTGERMLNLCTGCVRGSLGPEPNFLSVAFLEIISDHMKLLAYFNGFIFLTMMLLRPLTRTRETIATQRGTSLFFVYDC